MTQAHARKKTMGIKRGLKISGHEIQWEEM